MTRLDGWCLKVEMQMLERGNFRVAAAKRGGSVDGLTCGFSAHHEYS